MAVSRAVRAKPTDLTGLWRDIHPELALAHHKRLLQGFAVIARWSVGTGWCAGEDGRGGNKRNATTETRGRLSNSPVTVTCITPR